jgi:hypothetical protein
VVLNTITLTDNFQYRSQFADTDNVTWSDHRKNVQITHNQDISVDK